MPEHSQIQSENCHEPKHITNSTTADAGKVVTPSSSTDGVSVLRKISSTELLNGSDVATLTGLLLDDKLIPVGWAEYVDGVTLAPTVTVTTTESKLLIDAIGTNTTTHLPQSVRASGHLWDGVTSRVVPVVEGDLLMVRVSITVTAKGGAPTQLLISLDDGPTSTPSNSLFDDIKPVGVAVPYKISCTCPVYATANAILNGIQVFVKVDSGTLTVSDRSVLVTRISGGLN